MPPFFQRPPSLITIRQKNIILAKINLPFQLTASGPDLATGRSAPYRVVVGFKGGAGQCWLRQREVVGDASGVRRIRGSATQRFVQLLQVGI